MTVNKKPKIGYTNPVRQAKLEKLGFLRVGGLYRAKNTNKATFILIVSITESDYFVCPKEKESQKHSKFHVVYIVGEEIWNWSGNYRQLSAWEFCFEKLR